MPRSKSKDRTDAGRGAKSPPGGPAPGASGAAAGAPPPGLDAARHAADQRVARQADALRDAVFPGYLGAVVGMTEAFEPQAFQAFLRRLVADAGDPDDPVERMLLEQLALAHFRIGLLHARAAQAGTAEVEKVYATLAARLLGEFRRTALALRALRSGAPGTESDAGGKVLRLAQ